MQKPKCRIIERIFGLFKMDFCRHNIKELFETFSVYEKLAHKIDRVCILTDRVNDFFLLNKFSVFLIQKQLYFNFMINCFYSFFNRYFEKQIKKHFEILLFEFFSIFPKKKQL